MFERSNLQITSETQFYYESLYETLKDVFVRTQPFTVQQNVTNYDIKIMNGLNIVRNVHIIFEIYTMR